MSHTDIHIGTGVTIQHTNLEQVSWSGTLTVLVWVPWEDQWLGVYAYYWECGIVHWSWNNDWYCICSVYACFIMLWLLVYVSLIGIAVWSYQYTTTVYWFSVLLGSRGDPNKCNIHKSIQHNNNMHTPNIYNINIIYE